MTVCIKKKNVFSFAHTAKVGKTSLIMSLVSEEFPDEVCIGSQSDDPYGRNHTGSCLQLIISLQVVLLFGYV